VYPLGVPLFLALVVADGVALAAGLGGLDVVASRGVEDGSIALPGAMERVAAGRKAIMREREVAYSLTDKIDDEIEALVLGTKKVTEV